MENLPNGLRRLNVLQPPAAEAEFLKCCGSKNWARQMGQQLPFRNRRELLQAAEEVWWNLSPEDWLEAFRSHPKIGEQNPAAQTSVASLAWSGEEQEGMSDANADVMRSLAELNRRYEEKFGFIYIVCATGKGSDELLTILQERLQSDAKSELTTAAREQAKITELRLDKLLASLEQP
jgi:OHCU decarboxylase